MCKHSENPGCKHSDKNGTLYIVVGQNNNQQEANEAKNNLRRGEVAKAQYISFFCHHDFGVLQTNDCDEQSDSGGNAVFQILRDTVYDFLPEFKHREQDKDETLHKDRRESDCEGVGHIFQIIKANGIGKVSIQSQAC